MPQRLPGRRVVVVGAGTRASDDPDAPIGNGRAIAVLAAREGAAVACADRDEGAAAETARLVKAEGASNAVVVGDVVDEAACARIIDESIDALGGIDGLVCNVGIGEGRGLAETSIGEWDVVQAVDVRAHFLLCRAALPRMSEGGAIVFISSIAGLRPGTRIPAYDTSKAALGGLCRHVAFEGARGVRANIVAPGLIDTPLGRHATAGRPSRGRTPVPLGRQGTAWEVAAPVVFLLSDDASYVTGQIIAVDGGLSTLQILPTLRRMALQLDHLILPVAELDQSIEFFTTILGCTYEGQREPFSVIRVTPDLTLQLAPWGTEGGMHLAFALSRPEFEAAFERVKAAGIPYGDSFHGVGNMQGPGEEDGSRGAGKAVYFFDPNQHLIEIRHYDG